MDLASPALRVSVAVADMAEDAGAATVDAAIPKEAATADPAANVEPAECVDDPMKYAPRDKIEEKRNVGIRISVAHLRGTGGSDFEGKAAVLRGVREKNLLAKCLPCVFGERDFVAYGEVTRYVVVKGDNCFVFMEEKDPSPLYAIPLHDKIASVEDPVNPEGTSLTISPTFRNMSKDDLATILLKYENGKIAYQFTFNKQDGSDLAARFLSVVNSVKSSGIVGDRVSLLKLQCGTAMQHAPMYVHHFII